MKRVPKLAWIGLAVLLLIGAGAFLIGPAPDKSPTTSAAAVEASGADTLAVTDPVHDRPFDVFIWEPEGDDRGELVVISHGFSGSPTGHSDLAKSLAADGYTVAASTHPDIAGLESDDPRLDPLVLRPRHLSLVIDALEDRSDTPFIGTTLVGHSLGAYGALRLAGATPATGDLLDAHCADTDDEVLCSGRAQERFAALVAEPSETLDERVDRLVLLAPGYGPLFPAPALAINVPVLVLSASDDALLPGGQVDSLIERLPSGTVSDELSAGHYSFLRPCTAEEEESFPEICSDPEGVDRAAVQAQVETAVAEFIAGGGTG